MTTDFRFFTAALITHATSNCYRMWPGVLENMELLKTDTWDITPPDMTNYAKIITTEVLGTNGTKIQKQELVVTDCAKESEL